MSSCQPAGKFSGDKLLGLSVHERDFVVVGAKPDELLAAGFLGVGKSFPVFLHPETKEEYALARTERKTAGGYHGFDFNTAESVTLEEDLARRDLTINAIAESESGEITDPYGGQRDLQLKLLRHVSPAFMEDPVRVLRVARFAARCYRLAWKLPKWRSNRVGTDCLRCRCQHSLHGSAHGDAAPLGREQR